ELPPADVVLSPKLLPEDHQAYDLPGAGMAYFLAEGVLSKEGRPEDGGFMDLLSLAIVADVVPLKGENRYRLQRGLPRLANSKRPGLIELFKNSGIASSADLTEEDIAYRLAPQINSAGRILKADLAVELLLSEDQFQAQKYAAEIAAVNERRKKLQDEVLEEASALLENRGEGEPVVLYQPHWNQGIIGIAAGRLAEELQVPALLMCQEEDGETVTGSARSVPGIHINNRLKQCEKYLIKFGGHAGAAGFSLERDKLTAFRKNISRILGEAIVRLERRPVLDIDGELSLVDLKMEDYFRLRKLAPFGEGNPQPRFIAPDAEVVYSRSTTGARHLRLIVAQDGIRHPAIWWWAGEKEPGDRVDLIYSLSLNNFQGKQELQLVVQGIHQEEEKEKIEKEHAEKTSRDRKLKFQLLDYRNWKDKKKELPEFKDAGYYYEGLTEADRIETINRYQMSNKKTLVLLSCPPSIEIFKELIYASHPSKLVLAFCSSDLIDYRFFTTQLSGLVKYVLNSKNGEVDVYQLAALTGQLESTVIAGLQYLEVRGFISLDTFNPRYYLVRSGEEEEGRENRGRKFKALKSLLQETASFRKHLLKIKEEEINNIVN
ncbi:MAG TPA: DHHA1 domain-containing protein, partial [Halanaerobiales bacterium]|nr:DHHA1 domain-containing protein [Halanaerobiales bacterium]